MLPGQMDLMDFIARGQKAQTEADKAGAKGMAQAANNRRPWLDRAMVALETISAGWTGTGEDARHIVLQTVETPSSPNAWGSLMRIAVAEGMFEETGEWAKMKDKASHGRRTPVYRRL